MGSPISTLTSTQVDEYLKSRPDVASDPYYGASKDRVIEHYNKYGRNEMPGFFAGNPVDVYGSQNLADAALNPQPVPDLLEQRSAIRNELNLPQAEQDFFDKYKQLMEFDTATDELGNLARDQKFSLNKVRGIEASNTRQRTAERDAMNRSLQVQRDYVNALREESEARFGIKREDRDLLRELIIKYPAAGITYGDTVESAGTKLAKANQLEELKALAYQYPAADIDWRNDTPTKAVEKIAKANKKQASEEAFYAVTGQSYANRPRGMSKREYSKLVFSKLGNEKELEKQYKQAQIGALNRQNTQADITNPYEKAKIEAQIAQINAQTEATRAGIPGAQAQTELTKAQIDRYNAESARDYEDQVLEFVNESILNGTNVAPGALKDDVGRVLQQMGYEYNMATGQISQPQTQKQPSWWEKMISMGGSAGQSLWDWITGK